MATSKHKMCCAEYRATIRSRWGFRARRWLQHHDGRAAGCTSIDHGKFCSSLSVRRGASLFFPCPQRRLTELWAREFQRSSPGSFGKTSKLSWTLKYEKPLPTCLKFQLRPKTLMFGPPLSNGIGKKLSGTNGGVRSLLRSPEIHWRAAANFLFVYIFCTSLQFHDRSILDYRFHRYLHVGTPHQHSPHQYDSMRGNNVMPNNYGRR